MYGRICIKDEPKLKLYEPHLKENIPVISFQTQAELIRWSLTAGWGERRRKDLELRTQNYVVEHSSTALSLRWAEAMESAKRNGRPISAADAWIAATALYYEAPLITHNKSHFTAVDGLNVISER